MKHFERIFAIRVMAPALLVIAVGVLIWSIASSVWGAVAWAMGGAG